MAAQAFLTSEQRENTLAGISIVREAHGGGPKYAGSDGLHETIEQMRILGAATDAEGLARLLTGVTTVAEMLLDWIENEARNKQLLLERVRESLPDFEEPDSYPTSPKFPDWSTWTGLLLTIEKIVRDSPVTDPTTEGRP